MGYFVPMGLGTISEDGSESCAQLITARETKANIQPSENDTNNPTSEDSSIIYRISILGFGLFLIRKYRQWL